MYYVIYEQPLREGLGLQIFPKSLSLLSLLLSLLLSFSSLLSSLSKCPYPPCPCPPCPYPTYPWPTCPCPNINFKCCKGILNVSSFVKIAPSASIAYQFLVFLLLRRGQEFFFQSRTKRRKRKFVHLISGFEIKNFVYLMGGKVPPFLFFFPDASVPYGRTDLLKICFIYEMRNYLVAIVAWWWWWLMFFSFCIMLCDGRTLTWTVELCRLCCSRQGLRWSVNISEASLRISQPSQTSIFFHFHLFFVDGTHLLQSLFQEDTLYHEASIHTLRRILFSCSKSYNDYV